MDSENTIQDLESRILAKRQQIEFDRKNIAIEIRTADDNRENPDVSEEAKNFDEPAGEVVQDVDAQQLEKAEQELSGLLDELQYVKNQKLGHHLP